MPIVSVVIPTHNRAHLIERAVQSVLTQTYSELEIIVIDDSSQDETPSVMATLCQKDARVRYICLSDTKGAQNARVQGIIASTGRWVAFLDSDDELLPDSIQTRLTGAERSPMKPGLVYGDCYLGDVAESKRACFKQLYGYAYPWLTKELSLCPYSAMMIRKNCFDTTGYPDLHFPAWQDDDMVLTVGKAFPVLHCGVVVAIMHSDHEGIASNWYRLARGCELMVEKYRSDILKHHGTFRLMLWHLRIRRSYLLASYQECLRRRQDILSKSQDRYTALRVTSAIYCKTLKVVTGLLTRYLMLHFDHVYG